jgi:GntR family transcriptional regulator
MTKTIGFNPDPVGFIYQQMADHIEARIRSGELPPNKPLPAERRLADEYGVSLGTARRATDLLRERQLVFTLRSKGTFVASPPTEAPNQDCTSLDEASESRLADLGAGDESRVA